MTSLLGLITVTVIPNAARIRDKSLRIVKHLPVGAGGRKGDEDIALANASLVDRVVGREDV